LSVKAAANAAQTIIFFIVFILTPILIVVAGFSPRLWVARGFQISHRQPPIPNTQFATSLAMG
jgi:hypothetical protein